MTSKKMILAFIAAGALSTSANAQMGTTPTKTTTMAPKTAAAPKTMTENSSEVTEGKKMRSRHHHQKGMHHHHHRMHHKMYRLTAKRLGCRHASSFINDAPQRSC